MSPNLQAKDLSTPTDGIAVHVGALDNLAWEDFWGTNMAQTYQPLGPVVHIMSHICWPQVVMLRPVAPAIWISMWIGSCFFPSSHVNHVKVQTGNGFMNQLELRAQRSDNIKSHISAGCFLATISWLKRMAMHTHHGQIISIRKVLDSFWQHRWKHWRSLEPMRPAKSENC